MKTKKKISQKQKRMRLFTQYSQSGGLSLSQFKKMIQAIRDGDWIEAGNQMQDSRWYKQVTNRADRLISRMKAVGLS